MNPIGIRKAEANDFKALAEVSRKTFYESWRPVNTEEDMQLYMAEVFNEEQIKKDIEATANIFLLAETKEKIIGYAKLRTDSIPVADDLTDWMLAVKNEFADSKAIEMERLYVQKDYHNKKAGKRLMDESISTAREQNANWLWLGVSPENHRAMNFYKSYGFIQFGKKLFKLGKALDYDYLMKLLL